MYCVNDWVVVFSFILILCRRPIEPGRLLYRVSTKEPITVQHAVYCFVARKNVEGCAREHVRSWRWRQSIRRYCTVMMTLHSLFIQCARIVEEAVGKMQGISLKACIYGYVYYCTRSLFTAPISSTVDFIFTKLTRSLLEVPTRHWSCGNFIFMFPKFVKFMKILWIKSVYGITWSSECHIHTMPWSVILTIY